MTPNTDRSLDGFEQRLLCELRQLVAERACAPTPPPQRQWLAFSVRRSLTVVGAVACGVGAIALFVFSAGSSPSLAQAFPLVARPSMMISPAALAQIVSQNGPSLGAARLDVRHARAFATPLGTGYAVTDVRANLICVAAPGFAGTWGATCGRASTARRLGVGGLQSDGTVRQATYVDILPARATATAGRLGDRPRSLALHDGVLALRI